MRALIRKSFPYLGRDTIAGAVEEINDVSFEELKRARLVTDAPPEVSVPAVTEIESKASKHHAKPRHK